MSAEFSSGPENTALTELLDRSMPADAEAIATVVDAISEILTQLEIPEQKLLEVALAVQEALANAVVHGCGNDPSKQVRCRMKSDPQGRIVFSSTVLSGAYKTSFRPRLITSGLPVTHAQSRCMTGAWGTLIRLAPLRPDRSGKFQVRPR